MNAAARLVTGMGRYEHITPVLRDVLTWLPVSQRIIFKVAVLVFSCIHGTGPAFLNEVCIQLVRIPGRAVFMDLNVAISYIIDQNSNGWLKFSYCSTNCLELST